MTDYYFDSSALLKRYFSAEAGSAWTQSMISDTDQNTVYVAAITEVEIASATARLRREGNISDELASNVLDLLRYHIEVGDYVTVIQSASVVSRARQLLFRHTLRAMDAIQLASATEITQQLRIRQLEAPFFVTADRRLASAAEAEGLKVIDPTSP